MKSLRYYIEPSGESDSPLLFDDRYRLLEILGGGKMSYVVRAKDTLTDMMVSLKIAIPDSEEKMEDVVASYKREFSIGCGLCHTNILRPFMFNIFDDVPYIVMPYCSGGNISKYAEREESLSENKCWKILHDVASGLAYLHSKVPPLIHLDIKPDNILIDDNDGHYLITDFDISTTGGKGVKINEVNGTLAYMSPERFYNNAFAIKANDIWSLGAMLYEIMTGQLPFGETGGLTQKSGEPIPDMPRGYSRELCELVRKCMSEATWERPTAKSISEIAEKHLQ